LWDENFFNLCFLSLFWGKMKRIFIILLALLIIVPLTVIAGSRIVVVSNSIDYELAEDFVNYLDSNGRPVLHVTAKELDAHNQEPFIVILGGPDAPEGIGVQTSTLLSDEEKEVLRAKQGNYGMYVKTNVWKPGQLVFILAGNHRNDTQKAGADNQKSILTQATDARIEELSKSTLDITLAIEEYNYSYNNSDGYWYFRWVTYSMTNEDAESISPMLDVELQRKEGGEYKQVYLNTDVTHFTEDFKPRDLWLDTYTEAIRLRNGYYKIIVRLRDGADSTVIREDEKIFLI